MAFRHFICGDLVHAHGVQALWKVDAQAARRVTSVTKSAKTLERMTVYDLDRPEKVLEERKRKGKK